MRSFCQEILAPRAEVLPKSWIACHAMVERPFTFWRHKDRGLSRHGRDGQHLSLK
jgi:hypothetical protein